MTAVGPRLAGRLGLTRGVSWTLAGRLWSLGAGVVTIVLVPRVLGPAQQGAYYAIVSLLAAQVFAELGLNFVLVQRAARASATLTRTAARRLEGSASALGDVGALLRFATRWFIAGALLFGSLGGAVGVAVLSRGAGADAPIAPWVGAVIGATVQLATIGPLAVFEGAGFVAEVARVRLVAGACSVIATWIALLAGLGLWATAVTPAVAGVVTWLATVDRLGAVWRDLRGAAAGHVVAWRREILPVQARIAASWLAGYGVSQAPTALLFAAQRVEDAGRYGMTMTIANAVGTVASSWLYPSQPEFARLAAQREAEQLDSLFRRTVGRTMLMGAVLATGVVGTVAALPGTPASAYTLRVLPLGGTAALMIGVVGSLLVSAFASYARSLGGEPFLLVSVASSAVLLLGVSATASALGGTAVAITYAAVQWGIGVTWGGLVFLAAQRRVRADA